MVPPKIFKLDPKINRQVVYLCGPHGVGKSTLIEDLKQFDMGRIKEQIAHMEGLTDNLSRQIWRSSLHCIEHRENLWYAMSQPPNSVIIGDRSYLDDIAYVNAFTRLGWLTSGQRKGIFKSTELLYRMSSTPKPERFIVLLPPLDWNIARIEERWASGVPLKWQEDNFEYLDDVRDQFLTLANSMPDQVTIIEDTDRQGRIHKVKQWLTKHELEDFIVEGRTYIEGVRSSFGS